MSVDKRYLKTDIVRDGQNRQLHSNLRVSRAESTKNELFECKRHAILKSC